MFDNKRYMTKGIQQEIPLELQLFMWDCIDTLKRDSKGILDYLQVFELTKGRINGVVFQSIEHRQEVPEYSKTYRVFPVEIVDAKIFVIDDGKFSIMMLEEEY